MVQLAGPFCFLDAYIPRNTKPRDALEQIPIILVHSLQL